MAATATIPDQTRLRRQGEKVCTRLEADPQVYKVPTDKVDLFAIGDFLTAAECTRLVTMIDKVARPSSLFDTDYASSFRTSYSGDFERDDPFIKGISRRIDDLLGLDPQLGETIQGQRYLPGQQFKPHNDWFYTDQDYWQEERKRGGQRSWTAMAFLNQVEAGGATQFVEVGIDLEPKPGVLVVWNNANPDGSPNPDTLHAGKPVEAGQKYIITKWYRSRPWG